MYIFNESKFSRKVAKNENNNIVVTSPGIAINIKKTSVLGTFLIHIRMRGEVGALVPI